MNQCNFCIKTENNLQFLQDKYINSIHKDTTLLQIRILKTAQEVHDKHKHPHGAQINIDSYSNKISAC